MNVVYIKHGALKGKKEKKGKKKKFLNWEKDKWKGKVHEVGKRKGEFLKREKERKSSRSEKRKEKMFLKKKVLMGKRKREKKVEKGK